MNKEQFINVLEQALYTAKCSNIINWGGGRTIEKGKTICLDICFNGKDIFRIEVDKIIKIEGLN